LLFKKKYIERIYDDLNRPSALVGQACHKAVEVLLKDGIELSDAAIQEGLKLINTASDATIDYGKTGSREQMIKDFHRGVNYYLEVADMWYDREVLAVEKGMTHEIHDEQGNVFPLPAKCFSDVIWRSTKPETFNGKKYPKGSLFIEDHKFVRSYSDPDVLDPARLLQSMFNFHIVREEFKEAPVALLYNEVKLTENRDKTPQAQYYTVDYKDQKEAFSLFYKIYNDCTRELMRPGVTFLPNFFDTFDGDNAYLTYRSNLIGVDAPVQVAPKTKQVAFQEKTYVESATDKIENKNLTNEERIRLKLQEFGIAVEMKETHTNGSVVMYTMKPSRGIRMSSFEHHTNDLAIALKANSIRIEAPIPGTDMVGVEIPAEKRTYRKYTPTEHAEPLTIPLGVDVYGKPVVKSLADMPHLLVAGSTGSGKSVFLNTLITSLTQQHSEKELKLVLIDPKRVELASFKGLPHLLTAPIYDHDKAHKALDWLVKEMESRYQMLEGAYRNIDEYNTNEATTLPYIVLVIDEFADFMLGGKQADRTRKSRDSLKNIAARELTKQKARQAGKIGDEYEVDEGVEYSMDAETMLVRLAQMARAVGIHLVIATQRPTVKVVTGLIKANLPTRVCFMVTSKVESQVVLDTAGAEELVGKGDMLYQDPTARGLKRLQAYSL